MPTNVNNASPNAISAADLANMDIETALMTVQTQRANMLENQLKDQMGAVQARNSAIENLNNLLAAVRDNRPGGDATAKADTGNKTVQVPTADYIPVQQKYVDDLTATRDAAKSAYDSAPDLVKGALAISLNVAQAQLDAATANLNAAKAPNAPATQTVSLTSALTMYGFKSGNLSQTEYDQLIQNVTTRVDGLNSTQQLEMLRLQSLTNKRNEAFDIMTNFIKKMQDGRSNIVGNMR